MFFNYIGSKETAVVAAVIPFEDPSTAQHLKVFFISCIVDKFKFSVWKLTGTCTF